MICLGSLGPDAVSQFAADIKSVLEDDDKWEPFLRGPPEGPIPWSPLDDILEPRYTRALRKLRGEPEVPFCRIAPG